MKYRSCSCFLLDEQKDSLLEYRDWLSKMRVAAGGSELYFGENQSISCEYLYQNSSRLPIDASSIRKLGVESVVSTKEAMAMLNCTRQNIDDLVRQGRLKSLDVNAQNRMFYKKDILAL